MSRIKKFNKPVGAFKKLFRKNSTYFAVPVNPNFSELPRNGREANTPTSTYSRASFVDLVRSWSVLKLSSNKFFVKNGESLLKHSKACFGDNLINFLIKHTMFQHFCGGESSIEVGTDVKSLEENNIIPILNYSIEASVADDSDKANTKKNLDIVFEQMNTVSKYVKGDMFSPIKPTALCNIQCLESLASHVRDNPELFENLRTDYEIDDKSKFIDNIRKDIGDGIWCEELNEGLSNFYEVGLRALQLNQKVFIDAEYFSLQPSVDYLALKLMQCFNLDRVVFLNTFQCYLKSNSKKLDIFLKNAIDNKFHFGVKLVRGAYMHQEQAMHKISPVFGTIEETHESYNQSAYKIIKHLGEDKNSVAVFATHNQDSVNLISAAFATMGDLNQENVYFAQLKGMASSLADSLNTKKVKVLKLVPYGPINDVLPYLLRRAQENNDVLAKTKEERKLILNEVKRRLFN